MDSCMRSANPHARTQLILNLSRNHWAMARRRVGVLGDEAGILPHEQVDIWNITKVGISVV